MHRFAWDVHYQPLAGLGPGEGALGAVPTQLPIQAIPFNTVPAPTTPWVNPGTYVVKLTVDGKSYTQPIVVKQDPRVKTPALAMQQVYSLTSAMYYGAAERGSPRPSWAPSGSRSRKCRHRGQWRRRSRRSARRRRRSRARLPPRRRTRRARRRTAAAVAAPPAATATDTLWAVSTSLGAVMNAMQAADVAPTANTLAAVAAAQQNAARVMARWNALRTVDLPALNANSKAPGSRR